MLYIAKVIQADGTERYDVTDRDSRDEALEWFDRHVGDADRLAEVNEPPYEWEICCGCNGEGKSSNYLGAFTQSELYEDYDFAESYMRGTYDRPCSGCASTGKVKVPNIERLPEAQRKAAEEHIEFLIRCAETAAYERKYGC
jgi:hypothetical protein